MTIAVTLTIDDLSGVDTSFFFPGLHAIYKSNTGFDNNAQQAFAYYTSVKSNFPYYGIIMSGYDFHNSTDAGGIGGKIFSMQLHAMRSDGSPDVQLAHMGIDFGGSTPEYVPVDNVFSLTPDNMLNNLSITQQITFSIIGNIGQDQLVGSDRDDYLDGKGGADRMAGHDGNDRYYVDNGSDTVVETPGEGSDYVLASVSYGLKSGVEVEKLSTTATSGSAAINLTGNEFGQAIYGNQSNNKIVAMGGNDSVYGYGGNDAIYGGDGKDTLTGGLGNDQFQFDTALGSGNVDTIADYHNVSGDNDTIRLENAIFAKLTATGTLNTAFLAANATGTATDGNDYIVYNTSTGELSYDADGSGAGVAIQFATVTGHPALTAADFLVV